MRDSIHGNSSFSLSKRKEVSSFQGQIHAYLQSVINTEVSLFQGCPLRGIPLYPYAQGRQEKGANASHLRRLKALEYGNHLCFKIGSGCVIKAVKPVSLLEFLHKLVSGERAPDGKHQILDDIIGTVHVEQPTSHNRQTRGVHLYRGGGENQTMKLSQGCLYHYDVKG